MQILHIRACIHTKSQSIPLPGNYTNHCCLTGRLDFVTFLLLLTVSVSSIGNSV